MSSQFPRVLNKYSVTFIGQDGVERTEEIYGYGRNSIRDQLRNKNTTFEIRSMEVDNEFKIPSCKMYGGYDKHQKPKEVIETHNKLLDERTKYYEACSKMSKENAPFRIGEKVRVRLYPDRSPVLCKISHVDYDPYDTMNTFYGGWKVIATDEPEKMKGEIINEYKIDRSVFEIVSMEQTVEQ